MSIERKHIQKKGQKCLFLGIGEKWKAITEGKRNIGVYKNDMRRRVFIWRVLIEVNEQEYQQSTVSYENLSTYFPMK